MAPSGLYARLCHAFLVFDISRDVAMATNFVQKWQTPHFRRAGIQKQNEITPCRCMIKYIALPARLPSGLKQRYYIV